MHDVDAGEHAAIERLAPPRPADIGLTGEFRPAYVRGLACLHASEGLRAIQEFQRILDHRGVAPASPLYPLAYVQQARAYVLVDDAAKARKAYQEFLAIWKDADPDVPILQQAKAEYAKLQ
jgi:eukaryotic-like serine/threonine-protein kinase